VIGLGVRQKENPEQEYNMRTKLHLARENSFFLKKRQKPSFHKKNMAKTAIFLPIAPTSSSIAG